MHPEKRQVLVSLCACLGLVLTACADQKTEQKTEAREDGVSIGATSAGSIKLSIDNRMHQFGYMANCTISPVTIGVLAYEEKPNSKSNTPLGSFRIVGASDSGEIIGRVEVSYSDEGFVYEGPIAIDGKTMSWSGVFKKFDRTTLPKPAIEIGEVEGGGSVAC
ncbi:MAG: hypothetical protein AAGJ73_14660 [Pseudomonadota bacterium]